jgi:hypothetical protein
MWSCNEAWLAAVHRGQNGITRHSLSLKIPAAVCNRAKALRLAAVTAAEKSIGYTLGLHITAPRVPVTQRHHHHHHHHQITKLSHSINAIGPAPHRSRRKREHRSIVYATVTHIPSLHKIRRNAPRYAASDLTATNVRHCHTCHASQAAALRQCTNVCCMRCTCMTRSLLVSRPAAGTATVNTSAIG